MSQVQDPQESECCSGALPDSLTQAIEAEILKQVGWEMNSADINRLDVREIAAGQWLATCAIKLVSANWLDDRGRPPPNRHGEPQGPLQLQRHHRFAPDRNEQQAVEQHLLARALGNITPAQVLHDCCCIFCRAWDG
jgi:hypothetical protein